MLRCQQLHSVGHSTPGPDDCHQRGANRPASARLPALPGRHRSAAARRLSPVPVDKLGGNCRSIRCEANRFRGLNGMPNLQASAQLIETRMYPTLLQIGARSWRTPARSRRARHDRATVAHVTPGDGAPARGSAKSPQRRVILADSPHLHPWAFASSARGQVVHRPFVQARLIRATWCRSAPGRTTGHRAGGRRTPGRFPDTRPWRTISPAPYPLSSLRRPSERGSGGLVARGGPA